MVEDTDINYELLEAILNPTGAIISWARDGETALQVLEQQQYDLILMDIFLPKISGIDVIKRVREKDTQVPIIAITAYALSSVHKECKEAGCNDFLIKPLRPGKVIETISSHLDNEMNQ